MRYVPEIVISGKNNAAGWFFKMLSEIDSLSYIIFYFRALD